MFKRNLVRGLVVVLVVFTAYTGSFADIRVRFARGRTSATMSGTLRSRGLVCYVAGARDGQTLSATVSSRNGRVRFEGLNDTSYTEFMKFSGDHRVCLTNGSGATGYTITFSIQ